MKTLKSQIQVEFLDPEGKVTEIKEINVEDYPLMEGKSIINPVKVKVPASATILYQPARYKALYGGLMSGRTVAIADALIVKGYQKRIRWMCCRRTEKQLRNSVYKLLIRRINYLGLSKFYSVSKDKILGSNGTEILFSWWYFDKYKLTDETQLKMYDLDGAWMECAEECSEIVLDILMPTIHKEGSEMWFSWNRFHKTSPIDELFLGDITPDNLLIEKMTYHKNPFIGDTVKTDIEWVRERDPDLYSRMFEGNLWYAPLPRRYSKKWPRRLIKWN